MARTVIYRTLFNMMRPVRFVTTTAMTWPSLDSQNAISIKVSLHRSWMHRGRWARSRCGSLPGCLLSPGEARGAGTAGSTALRHERQFCRPASCPPAGLMASSPRRPASQGTPEGRTRLSPRMGGQRVNYDFMPELARTDSTRTLLHHAVAATRWPSQALRPAGLTSCSHAHLL